MTTYREDEKWIWFFNQKNKSKCLVQQIISEEAFSIVSAIHTTPSAYNGYGVEVTNNVMYLEEKDDKKTLQL
jgi:hypothetical protein